jgi:hypothetical protein
MSKESRTIPRPFKLHWGGGMIVEEISIKCEYHEPCIQLLEFDEGYEEIRFCYYDLEGRFQRGPMMIDPSELKSLLKQLKTAPRLRKALGLK